MNEPGTTRSLKLAGCSSMISSQEPPSGVSSSRASGAARELSISTIWGRSAATSMKSATGIVLYCCKVHLRLPPYSYLYSPYPLALCNVCRSWTIVTRYSFSVVERSQPDQELMRRKSELCGCEEKVSYAVLRGPLNSRGQLANLLFFPCFSFSFILCFPSPSVRRPPRARGLLRRNMSTQCMVLRVRALTLVWVAYIITRDCDRLFL